jgi:hypothetical protein
MTAYLNPWSYTYAYMSRIALNFGFQLPLTSETGSGAHPASYTMDNNDPFPGDKARPGRDADHSPPSSAEVVND